MDSNLSLLDKETSQNTLISVQGGSNGETSSSNKGEKITEGSLSPPNLSPIRGGADKHFLNNLQGPVSLVPNHAYNFNQFINNIPNFSGENPDFTVHDFIDKIIEIKDFAGWQEEQCVFAIKLKCIGEPQNFIKSQPHLKTTQNFTTLKDALVDRFAKSVDEAYHLQEFTLAKQQNKETNRAFLSRVLGLSYKCFANQETIREKLLVQKCLQGMLPEVRKFIMPHSPSTYQQIWDLALCQEKCTEYDQAQAPIYLAQASNQTNELQELKSLIQTVVSESDRKITELTNQVQTLLQLNTQRDTRTNNYNEGPYTYRYNRSRARNIVCFRCNTPGHVKRNCPMFQPPNAEPLN